MRAPRLEERVCCDVAVVGAGFTGLSTALHLAEQGASVVVVERMEVGWGGSGRAYGQVVPYAKHDEEHISATFGEDYGKRLIDLLASGPDLVYGLIADHDITCEPVRTGLLFAAHSKAAVGGLERRARFWQVRQQPVELLEGESLERVVGSAYYRLALIDYRGGCVNPLGYARGLASASIKNGARLFENSRVVSLLRQGSGWSVQAGGGEVVAEAVVLATDAYTDGLWPGLRHSILPVRAYHVMSSPISENSRKSILPGGQSLTDSRRLYSGIRVRPDGRLHMSVDGPPFSNDGSAFRTLATQRVRDLFPQVGELTWEEEISGWVGVSSDQYPRIYRVQNGVFAAIGLSGRGIAFGTLLGVELTKRILGKPEVECALPLTSFHHFPASVPARALGFGVISAYRLLDRRDLRSGYVRPQS
jgi:glycine/D-amino acid oxidase-like deaminating enzyme